MLRTFSGRQPHPAAAEAPQPGSDPLTGAAVAPPSLPERVGSPEGAAAAVDDRGCDAGSPSTEPPPAGSVAAGEAAWEAQLAALEASKAAKRASSVAPLVDDGTPTGTDDDDASDSDADDAELTAAIAEARIAARRLSLSVDGEARPANADEAPPPPPTTRTRSAPVPHKRRLSHEERATPLSHLRHLLGGRSASADRPASPPPAHVARASMAAARDGFARRGERLEGVNRAAEGLAEAARQYRENARKREAEARKSRSRWF